MNQNLHYDHLRIEISKGHKQLAVLLDPEKFYSQSCVKFLKNIPQNTTHLFVGGSTDPKHKIHEVIFELKKHTQLPVFIFPGDATQISFKADALLFLSLLSGNNPEFLIGQQTKAAALLKHSNLEVISTGYILIDGGATSSVARVSNTKPIPQNDTSLIVHTALAGQLMGAKLIYLEAGSGAKIPVSQNSIFEVKKALNIPLIVGGGIKTEAQKQEAYNAGADMVVMGTIFEEKNYLL